jgi:hypothetical protein
MAAGVLLACGLALLAPPASASQGELAGQWTSVDLDGSNQTLRIAGAGTPTYAIFLTDDATSGGCGGPPAKLVGSGRVDGDDLDVVGTLVCESGGNPIPGVRIPVGFTHDDATDTLLDFSGVVWHRAG